MYIKRYINNSCRQARHFSDMGINSGLSWDQEEDLSKFFEKWDVELTKAHAEATRKAEEESRKRGRQVPVLKVHAETSLSFENHAKFTAAQNFNNTAGKQPILDDMKKLGGLKPLSKQEIDILGSLPTDCRPNIWTSVSIGYQHQQNEVRYFSLR